MITITVFKLVYSILYSKNGEYNEDMIFMRIYKTIYLTFCIPYLTVGTYLLYLGFTVSNGPNCYFLKNSFYFEGVSCIIIPIIIIAGISLYNKKVNDEKAHFTRTV